MDLDNDDNYDIAIFGCICLKTDLYEILNEAQDNIAQ